MSCLLNVTGLVTKGFRKEEDEQEEEYSTMLLLSGDLAKEEPYMKNQLTQRLNELKAEYEAGQKMLTDLEGQQANLRNTLLRISGAIQVLEEELAKATQSGIADSIKQDGVGVIAPENSV